MDELKILEVKTSDYSGVKAELIESFEKEKKDIEYQFESYYVIYKLNNNSFSNLLNDTINHDESMDSLKEFVQALTDEGIETFITKIPNTNIYELYFSVWVGVEDEDLFDDDYRLLRYNGINVVSLSDIFLFDMDIPNTELINYIEERL